MTVSDEVESVFYELNTPPLSWLVQLKVLGISVDALAEPERPAHAAVMFHDDQPLFDIDGGEGADQALIFLARDELGEPADLVAWDPQQKRLAAWFGSSALLGAENLWAPRLSKEQALHVFESPLGWLRAGREGVVVVDPHGAAPSLCRAAPLVAESIEHGERLRRMLTVRPPRIFVALSDVRSAA